MAEYQVRRWRAWHHHMALVMIATMFLDKERMAHRETAELLSCRDLVDLEASIIDRHRQASTGIDGGAKPWDPPIERNLTKSNWSGLAEHGAAPSIEGPQLLPPAAIRFFHQARACRSNVCRFADRVLLPEQQLFVQFDRRSVLVFRRWTQGSGMRHAPS